MVEYQKRGLPHAHLLIILDSEDRLQVPGDVDNVIVAELPPKPELFLDNEQKRQATSLREVVLKCMVHGPCGALNPKSPCMVNGKCSKGYPKPFCSHTSWSDFSSYPCYRRRTPNSESGTAIVGNFLIDNIWIVPYNPYLSLRYNAHINVEACISPFAAKYLFLYINKVYFLQKLAFSVYFGIFLGQ